MFFVCNVCYVYFGWTCDAYVIRHVVYMRPCRLYDFFVFATVSICYHVMLFWLNMRLCDIVLLAKLNTYYVNVGDNPSPIVFEGVTHITPSDGSLMIWPGYLDHEVPPSSSVRKLFSFNFEVMVGSGPNKPMKNRF